MKKKLGFNDLVNYFYSTVKSKDKNKIGLEYELFCLDNLTQKRIAYFGPNGISEILNFILHTTRGKAVYEENNILGVDTPDFKITIEPGCQIEASFIPCKSLFDIESIVKNYFALLSLIEKNFNVSFWATGVDNKHQINEVQWLPKKRYSIMKEYFLNKGKLAHYMMKMTSSMHITIDYNSETDAIFKLSRATRLYNIFYSFANAKEDQLTRFEIWNNTDPERTGIPLYNGKKIHSFSDYINYALDIPMMFFIQKGITYPTQGRKTFRDYMEHGINGHYPNINDWKVQLNTTFPPVRFNNTGLELRFFDSSHTKKLLLNVALVKALFYNNLTEFLPNDISSVYLLAKESLQTSSEEHYLENFRDL